MRRAGESGADMVASTLFGWFNGASKPQSDARTTDKGGDQSIFASFLPASFAAASAAASGSDSNVQFVIALISDAAQQVQIGIVQVRLYIYFFLSIS